MKWEMNMFQMKEWVKNSLDKINEEEIGNIPEREFIIMIVKMTQDLQNRMEAQITKKQRLTKTKKN